MNYTITMSNGMIVVSDGTCADFMPKFLTQLGIGGAYNCPDPLGFGSQIAVQYPLPFGAVFSIMGYEAVATVIVPPPAPVVPFDYMAVPSLIQAVLVVAAVFMLFGGYRAGERA